MTAKQFVGTDVRVTSGEWHTLVLRAEGDRFAVAFNGRALFTARDRTIAGDGKTAL